MVKKDKSLAAYTEIFTEYEPLNAVRNIYARLVLPEHRLLRKDNGKLGAIKVESRIQAWKELLEIESKVRTKIPSFTLCQNDEKSLIEQLLDANTYPRGY